MIAYSAYGLRIHSALFLPELVESRCGSLPDVTIRFGKIEWEPPPTESDRAHEAAQSETFFFFRIAGKFQVRSGSEIIIDPAPEAEDRLLRLCLLGPVLAALLHQRGLLVLHASAVEINGIAVAFLGEKGWGKSTLAAYLQEQQHNLLADDVVAIDLSSDKVSVLPGFPQLKLWPSAAEYLGLNYEQMPQLQPELDKRAHRLNCDFPATPRPLGSLYVLDIGEQVEVEAIRPQEAVVELVCHSYMVRHLAATNTSASNFRQCAAVARAVPVLRLKRPRSLFTLSQIEIALRENLGQLAC